MHSPWVEIVSTRPLCMDLLALALYRKLCEVVCGQLVHSNVFLRSIVLPRASLLSFLLELKPAGLVGIISCPPIFEFVHHTVQLTKQGSTPVTLNFKARSAPSQGGLYPDPTPQGGVGQKRLGIWPRHFQRQKPRKAHLWALFGPQVGRH